MIFLYYIQETDKPNSILKLFNIVKLKENKIILPIEAEEKMDLKKSKVLANKTKKILSKTNCNKVILSKEIKKQQDYQNYLYTYNFDIIDGRWLFEVLMLKSLKYIIEKKNMKKEALKIMDIYELKERQMMLDNKFKEKMKIKKLY